MKLNIDKIGTNYSIYQDKLTDVGIFNAIYDLKCAFPDIPKNYLNELAEKLKSNNFTDAKIRDASYYFIYNFNGDYPIIEDIIKFDKYIKVYSKKELKMLKFEYGVDMKKYKMLEKNGRKVWALKSQLEKYNLI